MSLFKWLLDSIIHSFSTNEHGFSARKLTAFVITSVVVFAHIKWLSSCYKNNDFNLLPEIMMIDFSAILSLLGLTTWEKVVSLKNGVKNNNNNTTSDIPNIDLNINSNNRNNNRRNRNNNSNKPK